MRKRAQNGCKNGARGRPGDTQNQAPGDPGTLPGAPGVPGVSPGAPRTPKSDQNRAKMVKILRKSTKKHEK